MAQCATNPVTGEAELAFISEEQEISMGKQYYGPTIQSFDGIYPDQGAQKYINDVGQKLAHLGHRPNLNYEFKIVNTSQVNAFALPGGKICITRGLLTQMNHESQLAAVLGHEIGHVTARHAVRAMSRQMIWGGLFNLGAIALETKNVENRQAMLALGSVGLQAGLAKYGRDQEIQSDELGMSYMTRAHYDPKGALETFELLQKLQTREASFIDAMFASHPPSQERVANAKALISTEYALVAKRPDNIQTTKQFKKLSEKLKREEPFYKEHDEGIKVANEGRWNDAITHFQKALKGKPNEALFHADIGYVYMMRKEFETSKTHLRKAIQAYPDFFKPSFFLGYLKYQTKDYAGAKTDLLKADQIIPGVPQLRLILGESYEQSGDVHTAVEYYKYVYQADPEGEVGRVAARHLLRLGVLRKK